MSRPVRWPPERPALDRLHVDTQAIVLLTEEVTGRPPPVPPSIWLSHAGASGPTELRQAFRLTAGGGVVFTEFDLTRRPEPAAAATYELIVEGDAVLRPDRPGGYVFLVPVDSSRWPTRVGVRLLPGPAYPYPRHTPVVHGRVLRAGAEPVPVAGAVVEVREVVGGALTARCAGDPLGRFSAGIPRYRSPGARRPRDLEIRAVAPDLTAGVARPLTPDDFFRSVDLTVP